MNMLQVINYGLTALLVLFVIVLGVILVFEKLTGAA